MTTPALSPSKPMINPAVFQERVRLQQTIGMDKPAMQLHSAETEEALLAYLMTAPDGLTAILADGFSAASFYIVRNQMIYEAMLALREDGIEIDLITLADKLTQQGKLDEIGGQEYLSKLLLSPIGTANPTTYARVITGAAQRRQLWMLGSEMARLAHDDSAPIAVLWSRALKLLSDGQPVNRDLSFVHGSQSITVHTRKLEEQRNRPSWLPVPWKALSARVPVINSPDLVVVVGPEGSGKSALLACWAQFYAEKLGVKTCYIHTEMSQKQVLDRRLVANSGAIPYPRLLKPDEMTDHDWAATLETNVKIDKWAAHLDYWQAATVDEVKLLAVMKGMVDRHGTRVFVLDYLNDVIPEEKRQQNGAAAWRDLLAKLEAFNEKNGTVIITAAQLNADGGAYMIGRALKQKAALYLVIKPEELKFEHTFKYAGIDQRYLPGDFHPLVSVWVEKQRSGTRGEVKLLFVGSRYLWVDPPTPESRPLDLPVRQTNIQGMHND